MYKILMVCTANICRSPIAEYLLRDMLPEDLRKRVDVSSAGTSGFDGERATVACMDMEDFKIDMSAHRSRFLEKEMLNESDLILVMEERHADHIAELSPEDLDKVRILTDFCERDDVTEIEDPYGGSREFYQKSILLIKECMQGLIQFLEVKLG